MLTRNSRYILILNSSWCIFQGGSNGRLQTIQAQVLQCDLWGLLAFGAKSSFVPNEEKIPQWRSWADFGREAEQNQLRAGVRQDSDRRRETKGGHLHKDSGKEPDHRHKHNRRHFGLVDGVSFLLPWIDSKHEFKASWFCALLSSSLATTGAISRAVSTRRALEQTPETRRKRLLIFKAAPGSWSFQNTADNLRIRNWKCPLPILTKTDSLKKEHCRFEQFIGRTLIVTLATARRNHRRETNWGNVNLSKTKATEEKPSSTRWSWPLYAKTFSLTCIL